jgi:hypothetical protein
MLGVSGAAAGPTGGSDRERIVLSGGCGDVGAVAIDGTYLGWWLRAAFCAVRVVLPTSVHVGCSCLHPFELCVCWHALYEAAGSFRGSSSSCNGMFSAAFVSASAQSCCPIMPQAPSVAAAAAAQSSITRVQPVLSCVSALA